MNHHRQSLWRLLAHSLAPVQLHNHVLFHGPAFVYFIFVIMCPLEQPGWDHVCKRRMLVFNLKCGCLSPVGWASCEREGRQRGLLRFVRDRPPPLVPCKARHMVPLSLSAANSILAITTKTSISSCQPVRMDQTPTITCVIRSNYRLVQDGQPATFRARPCSLHI